jgi:predicted unusual protein kinase regulating ubiquinone biosynthesis (AarF/ABC1/UbiB family)
LSPLNIFNSIWHRSNAEIFNAALADGVRNLNFGGLSTKLGTTMYEYKFRIPPYYTLLVRSLTILEGIALASDPNYKVLGAAYPWVARRLLTDDSPELRRTLRNLLYMPSGGLRFDRLEALLEQAIRSPPRPSRPLPDAAPPGVQRGLRASGTFCNTVTLPFFELQPAH